MTSRTFRVAALLALVLAAVPSVAAAKLLVPMDLSQPNHLKAYGLAYWSLTPGRERRVAAELPRRALPDAGLRSVRRRAAVMGVDSQAGLGGRRGRRSARRSSRRTWTRCCWRRRRASRSTRPPNKQPWDDAVTLALTYAEIPYDTIWDQDVLAGELSEYDWLHLHHEDFTGQYGKFYASFRSRRLVPAEQQTLSRGAGARSWASPRCASSKKRGGPDDPRRTWSHGGFLFAMCSATDTFDIALAAEGVDIVARSSTATPADPARAGQTGLLDAASPSRTSSLMTDPMVYEFSDIDTSDYALARGPRGRLLHAVRVLGQVRSGADDADPGPRQRDQRLPGADDRLPPRCSRTSVDRAGGGGGHRRGQVHPRQASARGTFTFLGGHDPEDYQHAVGDPPTDLDLHPNSPGLPADPEQRPVPGGEEEAAEDLTNRSRHSASWSVPARISPVPASSPAPRFPISPG